MELLRQKENFICRVVSLRDPEIHLQYSFILLNKKYTYIILRQDFAIYSQPDFELMIHLPHISKCRVYLCSILT